LTLPAKKTNLARSALGRVQWPFAIEGQLNLAYK
jgi:hypothetical protein